MDSTDVLGIVASAVFLARLTPQPVRLARSGVADGVSPLAALNAVIAALAWLVYGLVADDPVVWIVSLVAVVPGVWAVLLLRRRTALADLLAAGAWAGIVVASAAADDLQAGADGEHRGAALGRSVHGAGLVEGTGSLGLRAVFAAAEQVEVAGVGHGITGVDGDDIEHAVAVGVFDHAAVRDIAIAGAGGRMGQANIRAVAATPGLLLHSAFDRPGSSAIGRDAGELAGTGPLPQLGGGEVEELGAHWPLGLVRPVTDQHHETAVGLVHLGPIRGGHTSHRGRNAGPAQQSLDLPYRDQLPCRTGFDRPMIEGCGQPLPTPK